MTPAPDYTSLIIAIYRRAVLDLRSPCQRQDALDWFECPDCYQLIGLLGIKIGDMSIRITPILALPLIDNRRFSKRDDEGEEEKVSDFRSDA